MKIEKMANIVMTEEEMKEAIRTWLFHSRPERGDLLLPILARNEWTIDTNNGEFMIVVDGIMETKEM